MEDLARETLTYWRRQAKQRRITTPLPAAVAWHWAGADVAAPAADLHPLLAAEGVMTRLRTELYAPPHAPGRIVILGGPARRLERVISEGGDPRLNTGPAAPWGQSPYERTLSPAAHYRNGLGIVGVIGGVCAASTAVCAGLFLISPPDLGEAMTLLACQLSFLMLLGGGPAMWLWLAELWCLLRGRPVRYMALLEDALARQVLRQAGPVYQFRHALLQDHLAGRAEPFGAVRPAGR